jgi:hypothetical protein
MPVAVLVVVVLALLVVCCAVGSIQHMWQLMMMQMMCFWVCELMFCSCGHLHQHHHTVPACYVAPLLRKYVQVCCQLMPPAACVAEGGCGCQAVKIWPRSDVLF